MPYTRIILGPRYQIRLEDLTAADCVFARCLACDRSWRIAPHRLFDRWPPHERLREIARSMRCPCGATGEQFIWHVLRASVEPRQGLR